MNDKKIIDVHYTQLNKNKTSENYYSLEEVCKILSVEEYIITFWCNKFNDILKIQSIDQFLVFDDTDLKNLKQMKELNIDKKLSTEKVREYLNQHQDIIITRKQELSSVSIVSVLEKIINSQNRKINLITNSHEKILKSNQKIVENQEKFLQMLSSYHQELSIDKLHQKEMLVTIQKNQLKETENVEILNNKVNKLSTDLKTENKEISNKIENVKTHIDESTEKSTQMQQENKKLLEEVAITMNEMKETNDKLRELLEDPEATKKIKKENDSWISKLAKKFK